MGSRPTGAGKGQRDSGNCELARLCGFKPQSSCYLKTGFFFFLSVNIYNSVKTPGQLVVHFEAC